MRSVGPYHQSNITTESFLHFKLRAGKYEFIRFNPDSLSMVLYSLYENPTQTPPVDNSTEAQAKTHACRAIQGAPTVFLDPSLMGTSFFHRVDVTIDNVPITSNDCPNNLFLQSVRCAEVFNDKPRLHFTRSSLITFDPTKGAEDPALIEGCRAFDHKEWQARNGSRIPVFLRGIFPFDCKNRTLESIDQVTEPNYYFPPDTEFEFRFHYWRTKFEAVFNPSIAKNIPAMFDNTTAVDSYADQQMKIALQEVALSYEVVELHPSKHSEAIERFNHGGIAMYNYDVIRGQHVQLTAKQSYSEANFTIMPYARLVYILFLTDSSTFPIESSRRPVTGWSTFPKKCSKMSVGFAGEPYLLTPSFDRFGFSGEQYQLTKELYHSYLWKKRITRDKFSDFFPRNSNDLCVNQALVFDLRNHMSDKSEQLTVRCEFGAGEPAPEKMQVAAITVHPTGTVTCKHLPASGNLRWQWNVTY